MEHLEQSFWFRKVRIKIRRHDMCCLILIDTLRNRHPMSPTPAVTIIVPILLLPVCVQIADSVSQKRLNYIGSNLDVRVKLTDNLKYDGKRHSMIITLTNTGTMPVDLNKVDMYFHSFFMVEPDYLPAADGYILRKYKVKLDHINGMLFKAKFLPRFGTILPGQSKEIVLNVQDWAVSKTDVPNNWYITSGDLNPVTLASTAVTDQSFVEDFTDPNQYKRYTNDQYSPLTPVERFNEIKGGDLGKAAVQYGVIPTPKKVAFDSSESVTIGNDWVIAAPPSLSTEAAILGGKLFHFINLTLFHCNRFTLKKIIL